MRNILEIYEDVQEILSEEELEALNEDIINSYKMREADKPKPPDEADISETKNENSEKLETLEKQDSEKNLELENAENAEIFLPKQKQNFIVKMARKHYEKKSKKAKSAVLAVDREIQNIKQEKETLIKKMDTIAKKSEEITKKIIGLVNANNFLAENFKGGVIGNFLKIAMYSNNKKIKNYEQERFANVGVLEKSKARILELENNISFLEEKFKDKESAVSEIGKQQENLDNIEQFGSSNLNIISALAINARSSQAVANLDKYYYREISKEDLNKINFLNCTIKKSTDTIIVRFKKSDKRAAEIVLNA